MTPEKEAELFTMLDRLLDMGRSQGEQLKSRGEMLKGHGEMLKSQNDVIKSLELFVSRLEGRFSVVLQWMSSMDQRFMALMSPYKPPRKPAA